MSDCCNTCGLTSCSCSTNLTPDCCGDAPGVCGTCGLTDCTCGNVIIIRDKGVPGLDGVGTGAAILVDSGVPSSGLGDDGDLYINTDNGDYYSKITGSWVLQGNLTGPAGPQGDQGVAGDDGADGSQILTGSGAPAGGLGVDTDFYLDTANGDYYTKAGGSWSLQGNLTGPQGIQGIQGIQGVAGNDGADGSQILFGTGAPAGGLGAIGDFYYDTDSGDVYSKTGVSTWTLQDNLTGPQGIQGVPGVDGAPGSVWHTGSGVPAGVLGVVGDFYLDGKSGDFYEKTGVATWTPQGTLLGSLILTGAGAPVPGSGKDMDLYINTTNNDYYSKEIGVWNLKGNLTGSPGADGSTIFNGSGAPAGGLGADGDYYLDTANGQLYEKIVGVWTVIGATVPPGGSEFHQLCQGPTPFTYEWRRGTKVASFLNSESSFNLNSAFPVLIPAAGTLLIADSDIFDVDFVTGEVICLVEGLFIVNAIIGYTSTGADVRIVCTIAKNSVFEGPLAAQGLVRSTGGLTIGSSNLVKPVAATIGDRIGIMALRWGTDATFTNQVIGGTLMLVEYLGPLNPSS